MTNYCWGFSPGAEGWKYPIMSLESSYLGEGPFSAPTEFLLGLAHFLYTFVCLPLGLLVCNFFHGHCFLLVPRKLLDLPIDHPLLHTSVH